MTTEERLRSIAASMRRSGQVTITGGTALHELLERAAQELEERAGLVLSLARSFQDLQDMQSETANG